MTAADPPRDKPFLMGRQAFPPMSILFDRLSVRVVRPAV